MTLDEITQLIAALHPEIADDYRATDDPHDDTPAMQITIATTDGEEWSYQTGDNSYTGGAYSYRYWGVGSLARDDNPRDVAEQLLEQVLDQMATDDTYPHIATAQDYRRFREDYEHGLKDLTSTSTGPCEGCEQCGIPHPTPADPRYVAAPMVYYSRPQSRASRFRSNRIGARLCGCTGRSTGPPCCSALTRSRTRGS